MRFVDECELRVEAGRGGNGCVAFRREKFLPFGGPSGGDGGRGGDVVLIGDPGRSTLYDLKHVRVIRAEPGAPGEGKDCYGRAGKDVEIRLPLGTVVLDAETGDTLVEVTRADERIVIAQGGRGGRGNRHFASPTERAPRRAEPGAPGEQKTLRLELKLMADVGLLGFPNVGKSTLVRAVSRARPKVADYPFTTLEPHLGVVTIGDHKSGLGKSFVLADIPGLIPGASEGVGLGLRFLRHLDRTRVLLHLVTFTGEEGRSPVDDYHAIRRELQSYSPDLAARPEVVAMTKSDLPEVQEAYVDAKARFAELGIELRLISAATHQGLDDLMYELGEHLMI
ncbi:MAG TPA: GTPase ObgE [Polyangiaceae bacterium]|nr:GTPase ObgE [Polyangiaceae bacterium]